MFKPWISIPVDDIKVTVDYEFGDVRIMFKNTASIDKTIEQLQNLRELVKEMEEVE